MYTNWSISTRQDPIRESADGEGGDSEQDCRSGDDTVPGVGLAEDGPEQGAMTMLVSRAGAT